MKFRVTILRTTYHTLCTVFDLLTVVFTFILAPWTISYKHVVDITVWLDRTCAFPYISTHCERKTHLPAKTVCLWKSNSIEENVMSASYKLISTGTNAKKMKQYWPECVWEGLRVIERVFIGISINFPLNCWSNWLIIFSVCFIVCLNGLLFVWPCFLYCFVRYSRSSNFSVRQW